MDDVIAGYPCLDMGGGLNYCHQHGLAYQRDMSRTIDYDEAYFDNYVRRENTNIAGRINYARSAIASKFCNCVVDVGVGSGEFIRTFQADGRRAYGYDINPSGVAWLEGRGLFVDVYAGLPEDADGLTLWDTLEHIPDPQPLFRVLPAGKFLILSLPVFRDVERVLESKHYKPYEHLYYFSVHGLVRYMTDSGFDLVEFNRDETAAGREGIGTFAFRKA